jgi:endo-1,4-beta-D-glucanase Y
MMKRTLAPLMVLSLVLAGTAALAQDSGEPLAPESIPGEAIYIPFPVAITADGDLADWAGVPTTTVDKGPSISSDPAEDSSFTFAVAADTENMYITMRMVDQHIIAGQHGTNFWNEDSLEFYFNTSGNLYSTIYTDGMFQINVNAADIGNTDPNGLTLTGVNSRVIGVNGFVFNTDDGWGFEVAIPLTSLNIVPAHGLEIGFQANANGASELDRNVKLIWSNLDTTDASWQNPSLFGRGLFFEVGQTDIPMPSEPDESQQPQAFDLGGVDWNGMVSATWEGYKQNYIYCGEQCGNNMGLVFDPNMNYQSVSEGIGYGLLMAVMMNDQATFDTIYDAAYTVMVNPDTSLLHWRVANTGEITGFDSATDAEEDVAAALIFAQQRVANGEWTQHATRPYGDQANTLIDAIYTYEVADGRYLTPGDAWGGEGQDILNLSYFAPAWYRLYDQFQGTNRWEPVITYGYRALFLTDGANLGLAPDWSTSQGGPAFDYCNETGRALDTCRYDMYYDAIRVPWRIGMDCLWFEDSRACQWSDRSARFLTGLEPNNFARMYDMTGAPIVGYQDESMTGMWIVAAMASGDQDLLTQLAQMLYTSAGNAQSEGYWGGSPQYYFNQSLAWFGASLLSGDFQNLYQQP